MLSRRAGATLGCAAAGVLGPWLFWQAGLPLRPGDVLGPAGPLLGGVVLVAVAAAALAWPAVPKHSGVRIGAVLVAVPIALAAGLAAAVGPEVLGFVLILLLVIGVFTLLPGLLALLVYGVVRFIQYASTGAPSADLQRRREARARKAFSASFVIGGGAALGHALAALVALMLLLR